jgi:lipopolysaccharide/colanic/teichoic acid biosynthesis glycosyltransferase
MSFLSRVLDVTISPESKAAKVEDQFEAATLASSVVDPLPEAAFRRVLCQERKRSERSRKSFLLMLVRHKVSKLNAELFALQRVVRPLGTLSRETDTLGWFESNHALGVIFSELGDAELIAAVKRIESKAFSALQSALNAHQAEALEISIYSYPRSWKDGGLTATLDPVLYPDLFDLDENKRTSLLLKRLIDIVGSVFALILLAPVFGILAALVKITSKGPVFFRQQRLGQFQVPFDFLKFRSMYITTDAEIHREYVKNFIAGRAEANAAEANAAGAQQRRVYKITNDPRVTWIGKFMRRTSLDEIPQFWNVLLGQMSLVGPRPPIGYEIEVYDVWHRRRVLEAKPGITGLWQVHGRSRTTFDDMVRLDLRYSRMRSPISDLKILLRTPKAVFSGDGAY